MALPISLRIPHEDVREATNNFHQDNLISSGGGLGPAYKGRILHSGKWVNIAARRLDRSYGLGEVELLTEVSTLSGLKHPNIVSLIGYCDEKGEKIIITSHEARGSLNSFLNSPNLTWAQRLKICLGVASALSYLHSDVEREYVVIHRNINSHTILLDENWEPKLSGFEISIKQSPNRMDQVFVSEPIDIEGYMDPAIEKMGGVTCKSDVYSFGVVMFEILCGRLAFIQDEANSFLAPLVRYHYENATLQDIIHPEMQNQMSPISLLKYSEVAYSCIEEEPGHRLDMLLIAYELENTLELQLQWENIKENMLCQDKDEVDKLEEVVDLEIKHEILDQLHHQKRDQLADELEESSELKEAFELEILRFRCSLLRQLVDEHEKVSEPHESLVKNWEHLKIPLNDIKVATDNFSDGHKIGGSKYATSYDFYRAKLYHFDTEKPSTVVIKRFTDDSSDHSAFRELQIRTGVKHQNIVNLVGFCVEDSERIIVIENFHGFLVDYLGEEKKRVDLTWEKTFENLC